MIRDYVKMIILAVVVLFICPGIAGWYETHYTIEAKVIDIEADGCVVVEDTTGNIWADYAEGFRIGDKVKVTFFTNYTDETRKDDIIEKIKKF